MIRPPANGPKHLPETVVDFGHRHPALMSGAFLVAAQAIMCIGLWNGGVPLGDEGVHIIRALSVGWSPRTWTSPFHDVYALVLVLLRDPVSAHLAYRFFLAETTALVLWRILHCTGFSLRSSVGASILWIGCGLGNTLVQFGNINLFAFSVAGVGISLVLTKPTTARRAICIGLLLMASGSRVEYLAPAGLLLLVEVVRYARRATPRKRVVFIGMTVACIFAAVASVDTRFFDGYLLLGLGQCYAHFVHRQNPGLTFNPFTEYGPLLDSVFGSPKTFAAAVLHNPRELARYFALNGLRNAAMVVPSMLNPRRIVKLSSITIQGLVPLIVVWAGIATGLALAIRRARQFATPWGKVGYLSVLASSASVSILLHIPDPRYWIGSVPIVYAGVAIALEALLQLSLPRWLRTATIFGALAWLLWPMPWSQLDNQPAIRAARAALVGRNQPTFVGTFPEPWVAFVRRGEARAEGIERIARNPDWSLEGIDLVIVDDSLQQSRIWKENAPKFAVLESPQFQCVFRQGTLALFVSQRSRAESTTR